MEFWEISEILSRLSLIEIGDAENLLLCYLIAFIRRKLTLQITVLGDALIAGNSLGTTSEPDRKCKAKIAARPQSPLHAAC